MKNLLLIILISVLITACESSVSTKNYQEDKAFDIAGHYSPEEAAATLIDRLIQGDTSQRDFFRGLTTNVIMYYDTIGSPDSARRFVNAFDSISSELPTSDRAHVLLIMNTPAKLAKMLVRNNCDEDLVSEIKFLLSDNDTLYEEFMSAWESAEKQINRLKNGNSWSIR